LSAEIAGSADRFCVQLLRSSRSESELDVQLAVPLVGSIRLGLKDFRKHRVQLAIQGQELKIYEKVAA
jgi:hypothetical protein